MQLERHDALSRDTLGPAVSTAPVSGVTSADGSPSVCGSRFLLVLAAFTFCATLFSSTTVRADEAGVEKAPKKRAARIAPPTDFSPLERSGEAAPRNDLALDRSLSTQAGPGAAALMAERRRDDTAPALFSTSLPLGRLAALPDLPRGLVPRLNPGLGLQQLPIPFTAALPERNPAPPAELPFSSDGPSFVTESSVANFGSTGSAGERSAATAWPRPRARLAPTSPVLRLEAEHSQLLGSLRLDLAPSGAVHDDLFRPRPEPVDPRRRALYALGRKMVHREMRRFFRREAKDQFTADHSRSYFEYLERRALIGQLGRGGRAEDLVIEERATELRNEVLDASIENPERDLALLQWGPLVLDDRGGVNIDVSDLKERDREEYSFEIAPVETRPGGYGESVLFPDERYRVRSNLKLNPDVREIGRDWNAALGKLTASVEIDWRAPVLEDPAFSAELGGSLDADGRYGLYLNFVIYGR